MRRSRALWTIPFLLASAAPAHAWDNHTLGTYVALASMGEVKEAGQVTVESFEAFLASEEKGLSELLDDEEAWARASVPSYPARPGYLRFDGGVAPKDLRVRFLQALRLNPTVRLGLYLQQLPGRELTPRPKVDPHSVTTLAAAPDQGTSTYGALDAGDQVPALEVVATASDEPDYGHDIGLWEDNHTWFGAIYGFGKQPFGNPAVEFSSQSPFHMGFYHEAGIVYFAAGFLKRTYPEMRIHQFLSLSRFAFLTGHAYWGWRFAGWALHYVQDLTQPYHATALPGVSVPAMLGVSALDLIGIHGPKNNQIQLVTNRHFALEKYGLEVLDRALAEHDAENPVLCALSDESRDGRFGEFRDSYPRDVIAERAHAEADRANDTIVSALPSRWVQDPKYLFGTTEPAVNPLAYLDSQGTPESRERMQGLLADLMGEFGLHTREFVRALR